MCLIWKEQIKILVAYFPTSSLLYFIALSSLLEEIFMSAPKQPFEDFSNVDLLRFIENYRNYTVEEVSAAKDEVRRRHLSSAEIQSAKEQLRQELKEHDTGFDQRTEHIQASAPQHGPIITGTDNEKLTSSESSSVGGILIALSAMALFQVYSNFGYYNFLLQEGVQEWDFRLLFEITSSIAFPIGVILIWVGSKTGWFIATASITFYAVSSITRLLLLGNQGEFEGNPLYELIENFSFWPLLAYFLIDLALLYGLNRPAFRKAYRVSSAESMLTMFLVILAGAYMMYSTYSTIYYA